MTFSQFCQVANVIQSDFPPSAKWPVELLKGWLLWAIGNRFLITATDSESRITGVAIARPVASLPVKENSSEYDERGSIIYLDLIIAKTLQDKRSIGQGIVSRFGHRPFVAFRNRHGRLRKHSQSRAYKALFKIKA